uniref:hypothetical protein n=1 Tax=Pseudomonas syringae TaxID=317 RepID=UPI001E4986D2|nr:hypothetical protein [Pseudomonas syringae]QOU99746.1 hypothetical protein [Pseudomonas syringae pv. actinidiae]
MIRVIKVGGGVVLLLLATVVAAGEKREPGPVAANITAQFYNVDQEAVDVRILRKTATAATVIATAPGDHTCRYEMVVAPADSPAPHGWVIAHTSCKS